MFRRFQPMHRLLFALLAAAPAFAASPETPAPAAAPAPAGIYLADPAHTSVTWSLDHLGLSQWTARFVGAEARLDWRPEDPAASTLTVEIDPASVRTDFPAPEETDMDGMIAGSEDFLAGEPIRFVSTGIEVTGPDTGLVRGDLTLRGETHPAELRVTFNGSLADHPFTHEAKVGFSALTEIRRSDWGMDVLLPLIGDTVTVRIETQLAAEES